MVFKTWGLKNNPNQIFFLKKHTHLQILNRILIIMIKLGYSHPRVFFFTTLCANRDILAIFSSIDTWD